MLIHPLRPENDRTGFSCGEPSLDIFLGRYALQNQTRHRTGVTYVAEEGGVVLGYMTLAAASLRAEELDERSRGRLPRYPLPVLRLARLAVDRRVRGEGIGSALLAAAFEIAPDMSRRVGCAGVVVDARPAAVDYYQRFGFVRLDEGAVSAGKDPGATLTEAMFLAVGTIEKARE